MGRRDRVFTLLLGAAALAWSCQGRSEPTSAANPADAAIPGVRELKVGDVAPDFSLPASDGKTYSLAELKGRTVVLMWFAKAFTSA
jgi:cytochrome oxidase Cu insertion factor (SCO1/SenC/PrrC family)